MHKGFSLIELLAVLVIVGILSAMTYPGYREYIVRAHRSDGQTSLLNLAIRMERSYSENNTYETATVGKDISDNGWYMLSIIHASTFSYALQATPIGTQASSDTRCQSLTIPN